MYHHLFSIPLFGAALLALLSPSISYADNTASLLQPISEYRGAEVVKRDTVKDAEYLLPLGKLKRLGRSWQPVNSLLLRGDTTSSLYKFGRTTELQEVYRHYGSAISSNAEILFECQGRNCGSSNAWANNFFQDYRLYGVDDNQFLLVTKLSDTTSAEPFYQVLYINRRGAGDVMVYLDRIHVAASKQESGASQLISFQTEISNFSKIRQHIEARPEKEKITALVSAKRSLSAQQSIQAAQQHIEILQKSLGARLASKVTFINIAGFGRAEFGEDLVTLLKGNLEE